MAGLAALCAAAAAFAGAQFSRPRRVAPHTGPRAVVLIAPRPDYLKRTADLRVRDRHLILPVTLFYQGNYYDAALYKSTPTPMALLAETVYEVQRSGEPLGSITVEDAGKFDRGWQGEGRLRLKGVAVADSGQRRARAAETDPLTTPAQSGDTNMSSADDRPVLRRHSGDSKPAAPAPPPAPAPAPRPAPPPDPAAGQVLVGVSDAEAGDSHSFALAWNTAELQTLTRETTRLASLATAKYLAEHFSVTAVRTPAPAPRTKSRTPASAAPAVALQQVEVRAFDLDADNNPEVVLTATVPLPSTVALDGFVYVTCVVRQEGGTDWRTLFSYITDDMRLDIDPRLEFIDAVDADGDGVAELLFRTYTTSPAGGTPGYRLYKAWGESLRLVYDSRGGR